MHFNELEQIPPGLAWNPSVLYIPDHSTWNPVQWNEEFWWWETVLWWGLIPLHSTSMKWNPAGIGGAHERPPYMYLQALGP